MYNMCVQKGGAVCRGEFAGFCKMFFVAQNKRLVHGLRTEPDDKFRYAAHVVFHGKGGFFLAYEMIFKKFE